MTVAKQKGYFSGSTAIVALLHGRDPPRNPNGAAAAAAAAAAAPAPPPGTTPPPDAGTLSLIVANLGDCRAVLCRAGKAIRLSDDHKPNRRDEKARIERAGGHVVDIGGIHRVCTAAAKAGLKLARPGHT